jgi:hypothetical protein
MQYFGAHLNVLLQKFERMKLFPMFCAKLPHIYTKTINTNLYMPTQNNSGQKTSIYKLLETVVCEYRKNIYRECIYREWYLQQTSFTANVV